MATTYKDLKNIENKQQVFNKIKSDGYKLLQEGKIDSKQYYSKTRNIGIELGLIDEKDYPGRLPKIAEVALEVIGGTAGAIGGGIQAFQGYQEGNTEQMGSGLGSIVGGALGAFGGPIGIAVGTVAGDLIGGYLGGLFDKSDKKKEDAAKVEKAVNEAEMKQNEEFQRQQTAKQEEAKVGQEQTNFLLEGLGGIFSDGFNSLNASIKSLSNDGTGG